MKWNKIHMHIENETKIFNEGNQADYSSLHKSIL